MELNWKYHAFLVKPNLAAGPYAGKPRRVAVLTPFDEVARWAVGASEDEDVTELILKASDRQFQAMTTRKKVSAEELSDFYSSMVRCLKLSVPVRQALEITVSLCRTPYFRGVVAGLYHRVCLGDPLSAPMRLFPDVFDRSTIALVYAGEQVGDLQKTFASVSEVVLRGNRLLKKIKGAMMYPAFVGMMTFVAVLILGWKVVPVMGESYDQLGVKLPWVTQQILNTSRFCISYWYLGVFPIGGAWLLIQQMPKILANHNIERMILSIPLFGPVIRGAILVRSLRSLSLLLAAKIPSKDAYYIVSEASGNHIYAEYFTAISEHLSNGEGEAKAYMKERARIPGQEGFLIAKYVAVGSFAGDVRAVLSQYSDILDDDVTSMAESLPRLLEPILTIFLTVVIGGIIGAIYLPYFELLLKMMAKH